MVDRGKAADIKDLKVHRFHAHVLLLAVHIAVNTGRLPLTREKWVRYRVDWLAIITTWKSWLPFIKLPGKHLRIPVPISSQ